MENKNLLNRTGLENLLVRGKKIVEIEYVDMDTAGGKIVNRGCGQYSDDVVYGDEVTVWMSLEAGCKVEEILEKEKFCEIIVEAPFTQPDGRKFARMEALLH